MATTARDLNDREAETRSRRVSKSSDNQTKVKFSKGSAKKKKSLLQELSNRHKDEVPRLEDSKASAVKRTGGHKRKENPSRISKQRSALFKKLNNKTFSFDKTRDAEFKKDFNDSDDEEPDWDPRLRAVKAKFEDVTIKKKKEAKKIWAEIEDARSDSDSANEKESSDEEKSDIDRQEANEKQNGDVDNESGDGSDKEQTEADVKWDSEVKNTLEGLRETRSEGNKSASTSIVIKGYDCDEDPWFWDSKGNAPVKVTLVPVGLKRRMGAQLKHSIEKVELKDFRREFYEKLSSDANRISDSSSQNSSSSSSIPSSLSSDIEESMGDRKARKELNKYLENSSDDEEVIVYTSSGPTIRRPPITKPPVIRKRGRRYNWSDQTSESSTSTSSSDTEKSSGSPNAAATGKD